MKGKGRAGEQMSAGMTAARNTTGGVFARGHWIFRAYRPRLDGGRDLLWQEETYNDVVNQGLDSLLGVTLAGWTQDTSWFVGVTSGHPTIAAGDLMGSHAGWDEFTGYVEANRQAWTAGAVSGQSVDNSASKATVNLNVSAGSIGGGFLVDNNTKGGSTGSLYAVGSFALKVLSSGDQLEVQATFTTAAA